MSTTSRTTGKTTGKTTGLLTSPAKRQAGNIYLLDADGKRMVEASGKNLMISERS